MSVQLNLSGKDITYSAHKRRARIFEPIAPVDTNHAPVDKAIAGVFKKVPTPPAKASVPKPASRSALRLSLSSTTRASAFNAPMTGGVYTDLGDDESALAAPPPQLQPVAASRSHVITSTSRTTPV